MKVDIEFFSEDAIENVVSCLHYDFDKVIYIGTPGDYAEKDKNNLKELLKTKAGVQKVLFDPTDERFPEILEERLTRFIRSEREAGNQCYLELTGGDECVTAIAGIVMGKEDVAAHQYNFEKNQFQIINQPEAYIGLEKRKPEDLTVEEYILLYGGSVGASMMKNYPKKSTESMIGDLKILVELSEREGKDWNKYCLFFAYCNNFLNNLSVEISGSERKEISTKVIAPNKIPVAKLKEHLLKLQENKMLLNVSFTKEEIAFQYKNLEIFRLLSDPGSVLESLVYEKLSQDPNVTDCMRGVVIDWDGKVFQNELDVYNEIDVLGIKNYCPVFISCKNGCCNNATLYELDTISSYFGGKYAEKMVVVTNKLTKNMSARAKELNIKIVGKEVFRL